MSRTPISPATLSAVLVGSRRRCCICYGLNRDTSLKVGQVAHLDGNSSNSSLANLAFLCFEHHDRLDSRTSQSKNFTVEEVKAYRDELHQGLQLAFGKEVSFGEARTFADPIAGQYILEGANESAELRVTRLADGTFHVAGLALYGTQRKYGPNTGEVNFIAALVDGTLTYTWQHSQDRIYKAILRFEANGLVVEEENWPGVFGMNVRFSGRYARAA